MTENMLAFLLGMGLAGCVLILAAVIGTPDAEELEVESDTGVPDTGVEDPHLSAYYFRTRYGAVPGWDQTNEPPD